MLLKVGVKHIKVTHKEIIRYFSRNKNILKTSLNLKDIWIRDDEFIIDNTTQEKADLVFQNKFNPNKVLKDTICYVLELKKDKGNHEMLGQLKKYKKALERTSYGHWEKVEGIAVAKDYTKSAKELLLEEGFRIFRYSIQDDNSIKLLEEKDFKKMAI